MTDTFDLLTSLQRTHLLKCFDTTQVEKLKAIANCATYDEGEVLMLEKQIVDRFFVIESGRLMKIKGEDVIEELTSGDSPGLFHFYQGDPAYATLKVGENGTVVWVITAEDFKGLLHEDRGMNETFISFLNYRIRSQSRVLNVVKDELEPLTGLTVAFFDTKPYMKKAFDEWNVDYDFNIKWFDAKLSPNTAVLAQGSSVVCCFVNDNVNRETVQALSACGVTMIAMRCAGFDNVDLDACSENNIIVTRVPAYSPYAVAEFAVALMMELNRKVFIAVNRVKNYNFSLNGLIGFDMYGKTVGVIGTGKIGRCLIDILIGFGCRVICYDVYKSQEVEDNPKAEYVELDYLYANSDIISVHVPLLDSTKHMLNLETFDKMKDGVIIINTSRGGLVNSQDLLTAISERRIGAVALDVYEGEKKYFFEDTSDEYIDDSTLTQLLAQKNVIVTSHQAFLTKEALDSIAKTTLASISDFEQGKRGSDISNTLNGDQLPKL